MSVVIAGATVALVSTVAVDRPTRGLAGSGRRLEINYPLLERRRK